MDVDKETEVVRLKLEHRQKSDQEEIVGAALG